MTLSSIEPAAPAQPIPMGTEPTDPTPEMPSTADPEARAEWASSFYEFALGNGRSPDAEVSDLLARGPEIPKGASTFREFLTNYYTVTLLDDLSGPDVSSLPEVLADAAWSSFLCGVRSRAAMLARFDPLHALREELAHAVEGEPAVAPVLLDALELPVE